MAKSSVPLVIVESPAKARTLARFLGNKYRVEASYGHIRDFEELLTEHGTIILKYFLHISKDEQKKRLHEREKESVKAWKLNPGDWREREHWDDYTTAYEDALNLCSTKHAPWFIVPADKKWFRNLAVAQTLRDALMPFREGWLKKLEEVGRQGKKAIDEYRRGRA